MALVDIVCYERPLSQYMTSHHVRAEKMTPKLRTYIPRAFSTAQCNCRYFTASMVAAAVALLLLGNIGGIVTIISIFEDYKTPNFTDYGIVIDAGSSHSTLWVFSWNGRKVNNTGEIDRYARLNGHDAGIDHYVGNVSAAAESISTLVTQADAIVQEVKERTWLYLGATAGMRLVQERNATAANAIMNAIKNVLKKSGFITHEAAIISGVEEASSGWTTVNCLRQNFLLSRQTVGTLDFGGASLELAFESVDSNKTVKLYYHNYTLYAHSYLCYGRDQMELRLLANLAQNVTKNGSTVENPCLPSGFQMSKTVDAIWSLPCVTEQHPPSLSGSDVVSFNGTSDSARCAEEVERLFPSVSCNHETCGINGTFQPLVNGTYFALGLFKVIRSSLPKLQSCSDEDRDLFNTTVQSWCHATLTELKALYPGEQEDHTVELCFDGHLMWTTLISGLNFSCSAASSWTVMFESKINKVPVAWPLGYMTEKTLNIFTNDTPYGYDRAFSLIDLLLSIVLLSLVAIILTLLFIATVRVCLLMKPRTHEGYARL